jgi:epoxide hydrolase-like predicted phosphatase
MIRALIFDLGGVVIPFDFRRGYAAMEPLCAYPVAEIPKRIRSTDLVHRYETGQIGSKPFVEELSRLLDLRVSFDQFCALWTAIFLPGSLLPESLFERLRPRYRLIALSNTNEIHYRHARANYPALDHFDDLVLSYQAGCAKPDRRIYDQAVSKAGCRPEECLFIDDVEAYVEGARSAGLEAIRFEGYPQLEAYLQDRGIL